MQPALSLAWLLVAALPAVGSWRLAGPYGGSARSVAIDPQQRNLLLAGSRDSLLYRSDDAGVSWRLLPFPAGAPGVFNSLIINPKESGHFYAGLDAGDSPASGVYESKDGGEHWQLLAGLRGARIESLAMWPGDPRVLAAGTSKGVFLTNDGGETWRRISSIQDPEMQEITALTFDPADSKILYAGTPHLPWKTLDGGATWHSIHTGLIDDSDIFSIRVDPARPQLVLASACSGIYRSDSAGESWKKIQGIPGTHRRTHVIAQDPRSPETIFAGTTLGLFKSPDGGKTWRHLTFEQVNWMVFDPVDPRILYLATEHAGIWKSTDSGEDFRPVNEGFANHRLSQITSDGRRLYASSAYEGEYGGIFVSADSGATWSLQANEDALAGRNLNSLTAAPGSNGALFAASEDAVLKSSDAGRTWSPLPVQPRPIARVHGQLRIHALRAVQAGKVLLFAGTQNGLFRSANAGMTWEAVKGAGITGVPILAIYAPPRGVSRLAVQTASALFISEDVGKTWQPAFLPDSSYYLYDLALPLDAGAPVLAATSRGLLRSADGGVHWARVTDGLPAATVDSVRFHPTEKQEAFLVEFGNVYRSTDGGASWTPFPSEGLEHSSIRMLWFAPDLPGRIFAVSAARSALVFDLSQPALARQNDHVVSSSQ
ncbi:MAG TPA: hypothetical protein VMB25_04265 [Bryobacteraceae bacterium]|nr:hypothetical protein [Bryobacteraceae bacterium]